MRKPKFNPFKAQPAEHVYIVAGSHKQAADFARGWDIPPGYWTFVHKPEQLRGVRGQPYIKIGTYYNKRNYIDILNELVAREMVELVDNEAE